MKTNSFQELIHSPGMERRLSFYPAQLVGIGILIVVVALALTGVLGESVSEVDEQNVVFAVHVEYPSRFRYQAHTPLIVILRNISDQTQNTVTVDFSSDYITRFPDITFNPPISRITAEDYEIDLGDLPSGATRMVTAELEGDEYGLHDGVIRVTASGTEEAVVSVETFVFP